MPRKLTNEELALANGRDMLRTLLRLRHRMEMRIELNDKEAVLVERFEKALKGGEAFSLDAKEILELTE